MSAFLLGVLFRSRSQTRPTSVRARSSADAMADAAFLHSHFRYVSDDELDFIVGSVGDNDLLCLALVCVRMRNAVWRRCDRKERFPPYSTRSLGVCRLVSHADGKTHSISRLLWLKTQGCPFTIGTAAEAAFEGRLEVLQWLRQHECPWEDSQVLDDAAANGHQTVIEWAVAAGCPMSKRCCENAARGGHFNLVKWLWARGHPLDGSIGSAGARGDTAMMQWLRDEGCSMTEEDCASTASEGQLEALQWLRSKGCPWDDETTWQAAYHGHLALLQWAHSSGCPLSRHTIDLVLGMDVEDVSYEKTLEILDWLLENDCPFDSYTHDRLLGCDDVRIPAWPSAWS